MSHKQRTNSEHFVERTLLFAAFSTLLARTRWRCERRSTLNAQLSSAQLAYRCHKSCERTEKEQHKQVAAAARKKPSEQVGCRQRQREKAAPTQKCRPRAKSPALIGIGRASLHSSCAFTRRLLLLLSTCWLCVCVLQAQFRFRPDDRFALCVCV